MMEPTCPIPRIAKLEHLRTSFERLLEAIAVLLVVVLTALVVAGSLFRYIGHALGWYDEIASILLVWLTYYGAALAALKGSHIGVPALINALPPNARIVAALFAEACVFLFLIVIAVTGFRVLPALAGDNLVSLPWVPLWFTQSAVPIGTALFIIAEALRLPQIIADARGQGFIEAELREAVEGASLPAPVARAGQEDERRP